MSRRQLRISPELALSPDAVTETFAILAKRGAGKTYTASVLVEEMLNAKLQVVVVDPMGAWWGLRSSADGKGDGFEIPILGGDRGDVPLEAAGGTVVADLIVDEGISAVLDLADFSKTDRRRFVADFLERLYQRNRSAMHVVLEEADLFAPEGKLKRPGDEQMLGAVYDLVRRGRGRGIGTTLITQRSASLSKEVLTQTEILVALRTTGPHDRAAIESWIDLHGDKAERDRVLAELASLPTGEAYVWWPVEGILRRVKVRERKTFDSSATPKPGETKRAPKTLADVDLGALQERMAATIERAKADDPRELRRQITDLNKRVAAADKRTQILEQATAVREPETIVERVEVPVFAAADRDALRTVARAIDDVASGAKEAWETLNGLLDDLERRTNGKAQVERQERREEARPRLASVARPPARPAAPRAPRPAPPTADVDLDEDFDFKLSSSQQKILDALRALELIGVAVASKSQLALFAKASPKSSTYTNNLGALKNEKNVHPWPPLIDYPSGGTVALTSEGRAFANADDAPATTEELHSYVEKLVGAAKWKLLEQLISYYDAPLEKATLAELAGYSATSSTYTNMLGSLRSLGLIGYPAPGMVVALPILFPQGA